MHDTEVKIYVFAQLMLSLLVSKRLRLLKIYLKKSRVIQRKSPKTGHLTSQIALKPDEQLCGNKIKLTVFNENFLNCNF